MTGRNNNMVEHFTKYHTDELMGLLNEGNLSITNKSTIPKGERIFGISFAYDIKTAREVLSNNSRLVAQNYSNLGATRIQKKAPTVQRAYQRLFFPPVSSNPHITVYSRIDTKSYFKSGKPLQSPVYIRVPSYMRLTTDTIPRVVKLLYGIP